MSIATAARTASSWRSRWRRRSSRAASPGLPAAVPENPTLPDSTPTRAPDPHEGQGLLVGADEPKEMGIGLAQAPVQPVSAGDREDAGEDAVLVKLARGRDGIGHHYARGEDVHRVVLGLPAWLGTRIHEP